MPELPEVETMCRGIALIVGRTVLRVERPKCQRKPISIEPRIDHFHRRAVGKTVSAIQRFGKRVVIWLADERHISNGTGGRPGHEAVVIEPRMTGLVLLAVPPTAEHLRLRIKLKAGPRTERSGAPAGHHDQLLFWDRRGLGLVRLLTATEFAQKFGEHGTTLGPDAIAISASELKTRLCRSRRPIKVALLDQKAVAGIGNLYASEILHVAAIHPASRCDRLRTADWDRLHAATLAVLTEAIRCEGSTLSDGTYRNALNEAGGYQNHHRAYDRAGNSCPSCHRGIIRRIVQGQRSTFFCPVCQDR